MPVAAILGSAHRRPELAGQPLTPVEVKTRFGPVTLHRHPVRGFVLFRHEVPHRLLPHQINWRAHAAALREVGVRSVLTTSSVGVLDPELPLYRPMLVRDLFWLDNRLPDGTAATMWPEPHPDQGHLVVDSGLLCKSLTAATAALPPIAGAHRGGAVPRLLFAYVPGPRTKTAAENTWLAKQGVQVNSMSIGPEIVLANELEMSVVALVVGHKYSVAGGRDVLDQAAIDAGLEQSRMVIEAAVDRFLCDVDPAPFGNHLHRLS